MTPARVIAIVASCSLSAAVAGAPIAMAASAARRAVLDKPATFYGFGKQESLAQRVVLHVTIPVPGEFIPTNAGPPLMMLGGGVCQLVQEPIGRLDVDALCPPLEEGDETTVWLTAPGAAPFSLSKAVTARELARALARQGSPGAADRFRRATTSLPGPDRTAFVARAESSQMKVCRRRPAPGNLRSPRWPLEMIYP